MYVYRLQISQCEIISLSLCKCSILSIPCIDSPTTLQSMHIKSPVKAMFHSTQLNSSFIIQMTNRNCRYDKILDIVGNLFETFPTHRKALSSDKFGHMPAISTVETSKSKLVAQLQLMMRIVGLLQFYVLLLLAFSLNFSHRHVAKIMSLGEAEILWDRCGRGNLL